MVIGLRTTSGRHRDSQVTRGSTRGAATDVRVLDGSIDLLATQGWGDLSFLGVANRVGLSDRAVRLRGRTHADLGAFVWRNRLGPALADALNAVVAGLSTLRATGSPDDLADALVSLTRRNAERDAAAEVLIQGLFHPEIRAAIHDSLDDVVLPAVTPAGSYRRTEAARAAYVLGLALGLLITNRYPRAQDRGIRADLVSRGALLIVDREPVRLPSRVAKHMDDYPVLAPDDPALDILLNQALELVGTRGFDGVTVAEIAASAGYTEGMVFHRYRTKLEMLVDATQRHMAAGFRLNNDYFGAIEAEYGPGVAAAVAFRESQRPGRELGRGIVLEQIRLAWHYPELFASAMAAMDDFRQELLAGDTWFAKETEAEFHISVAADTGGYLLPLLAPEVYRLPYDVVTIPVSEELRDRARRRRTTRGRPSRRPT